MIVFFLAVIVISVLAIIYINNYNDSESNIKEPSDNVLKKNVKHKNLVIKEKSVDMIILCQL